MACVSGHSKRGIGGDALGLEWALIQAGAQTLLSTLWYMHPKDCELFFTDFYKNYFEKELSAGQAYNETVMHFQNSPQELTHPLNWSGFVLTGRWL